MEMITEISVIKKVSVRNRIINCLMELPTCFADADFFGARGSSKVS